MTKPTLVIMAAGMGSRYGGLKQIDPVDKEGHIIMDFSIYDAKRAGFEMLMIHGGHGWLVNQFLSPYFNHRQDVYGGSLENRCRLAIEGLKSVREAVGEGFPIEFRMSGSELFEGGYDLSEGVKIAQMIEPYVAVIGDASKVSTITNAVYEEYHVALHI